MISAAAASDRTAELLCGRVFNAMFGACGFAHCLQEREREGSFANYAASSRLAMLNYLFSRVRAAAGILRGTMLQLSLSLSRRNADILLICENFVKICERSELLFWCWVLEKNTWSWSIREKTRVIRQFSKQSAAVINERQRFWSECIHPGQSHYLERVNVLRPLT